MIDIKRLFAEFENYKKKKHKRKRIIKKYASIRYNDEHITNNR